MRTLILLFILLCSFSSLAMAQVNFTHEKEDQNKTIDQQLGITKTQKNWRYDGLSSDKKVIAQYFDYCIAQKNPLLYFDAKKAQCDCMVATIPLVMTPEEITGMSEDTAKGLSLRRKMLDFAYGRCMYDPAKLNVYSLCINNKAATRTLKSPEKMCQCVADYVSQSIATDSIKIIDWILKNHPETVTPLNEYIESSDFLVLSERADKICYTNVETYIPPYPGLTPAQNEQLFKEKNAKKR